MKRIIITSLIFFLIFMVTTTLSNKALSQQKKTAAPQPTEKSKVEERLAQQRQEFEQNFADQPAKILTDLHRQNLQRIRALEGKVRLLEERLMKLEAMEKNQFYQQRKLEERLRLELKKRY